MHVFEYIIKIESIDYVIDQTNRFLIFRKSSIFIGKLLENQKIAFIIRQFVILIRQYAKFTDSNVCTKNEI